jgi:hypothetical protein
MIQTLHYHTHVNDAIQLMQSQISDGWSRHDINHYWYCLNYDPDWYAPLIDQAEKNVQSDASQREEG